MWHWQPRADGGTAVLCVRFDAAGRRVALGLASGAIELVDARTGAPLSRLPQRAGYVLSVAFDKAGERLVAGYSDGTAKVWRLPAMEAATASDESER